MPKKKQSELPLPVEPAEAEAPSRVDPAQKQDPVHFEQAVDRLGQIVERLESEELALDDSLKLFEEGVRLARTAQTALDKAEKRVEELLAFDEAGNAIVQELEPE